jgi:hypothetical protein
VAAEAFGHYRLVGGEQVAARFSCQFTAVPLVLDSESSRRLSSAAPSRPKGSAWTVCS